jgi:hypothetical protein
MWMCADAGNGSSGQQSGLGGVPTTGSARSGFYFLDRAIILMGNGGAGRILKSRGLFFCSGRFFYFSFHAFRQVLRPPNSRLNNTHRELGLYGIV